MIEQIIKKKHCDLSMACECCTTHGCRIKHIQSTLLASYNWQLHFIIILASE